MPLVQALTMDYVVLWRLGRLQARASESEAKALALYRELLKCAEAMPRSFTQAKSTRCFANLARWHASVGMVSVLAVPHAGQVIVDV